jgi:4-carboxymuconolactone decarboxylase
MAQPPKNEAGLREERILPADVYPESLSRLSPLRREGLSEEGRVAYDALSRPGRDSKIVAGLQGPGGVWLRLPGVGWHINEATRILRSEIGLDPRLTELAILAAAREMDSQFQWTMHEPVARKEGLSEKIIDLVKSRKPVADTPETESVIIELAREALGAKKVCSQTYARAMNIFGENGLLNLVTLMANYALTAIVLCLVDQQLHDGQTPLLPPR